MTLENKYNRGTHGDSSLMLSTVVLSNENQTCRDWEAPTSTGGGEDVTYHSLLTIQHKILFQRLSGFDNK